MKKKEIKTTFWKKTQQTMDAVPRGSLPVVSCSCFNESKSTKAFFTNSNQKKTKAEPWKNIHPLPFSLFSIFSFLLIQIRHFHATFCITNKCLIVCPPLLTKLARVKWVANHKRIQWRIWFQFLCLHVRISPQTACQVSSLWLRTYVARNCLIVKPGRKCEVSRKEFIF